MNNCNTVLSKNDKFYLSLLFGIASNSTAVKRKVGALIGNANDTFEPNILSTGFNKMSIHLAPKCEDTNHNSYASVFHAEEVAIVNGLKIYSDKMISESTIYCTYSPCINCCKLIVLSGIKRLIYIDKHAVNFDTCGELNVCCEDYLLACGVTVIRTNTNFEIIDFKAPIV